MLSELYDVHVGHTAKQFTQNTLENVQLVQYDQVKHKAKMKPRQLYVSPNKMYKMFL